MPEVVFLSMLKMIKTKWNDGMALFRKECSILCHYQAGNGSVVWMTEIIILFWDFRADKMQYRQVSFKHRCHILRCMNNCNPVLNFLSTLIHEEEWRRKRVNEK